MRHLLPCAALALLPIPSHAGQTCSAQLATPLAQTNWSTTIAVPRFDPALGTLQSVRLTLYGHVEGRGRAENVNASPAMITLQLGAQVSFAVPNQPGAVSVMPTETFATTLSTFDGVIDFTGPSGVDRTFAGAGGSTSLVLSSPAHLGAFTGAPHAPGTIAIPMSAVGASVATGPGALVTLFETRALGAVQVCYTFDEPSPFCAGDGTGSACPCANASAVGAQAGCVNSRGLAARLRGRGASRLAQDLLVLTADGLPPTSPAVLFQGTQAVNGGAGAAFGDGLRCAEGSTRRLSTQPAQAGVSSWPGAGAPRLSVAGQVTAPGRRTYQVLYRDAPLYCTSATFNLTQGVDVLWVP